MHLRTESALETRLAEVLMRDLVPCDLGDGIEVIHDVEVIEIEMDCDLDDPWYSAPYERIEIQHEPATVVPAFEVAALGVVSFERSPVLDTLPFAPYEPEVRDESTFVLSTLAETVPYPRSEVDTVPFVRHRN
jgi:hypothetical protein